MMFGGGGIWIVSGVGISYTLLFRLFEFDRLIGEFVEGEAQLPWNWQWWQSHLLAVAGGLCALWS